MSNIVVEGMAVAVGMVDVDALFQGDLEEDTDAVTRDLSNALEESTISTLTAIGLIAGLVVKPQARRKNPPLLLPM